MRLRAWIKRRCKANLWSSSQGGGLSPPSPRSRKRRFGWKLKRIDPWQRSEWRLRAYSVQVVRSRKSRKIWYNTTTTTHSKRSSLSNFRGKYCKILTIFFSRRNQMKRCTKLRTRGHTQEELRVNTRSLVLQIWIWDKMSYRNHQLPKKKLQRLRYH